MINRCREHGLSCPVLEYLSAGRIQAQLGRALPADQRPGEDSRVGDIHLGRRPVGGDPEVCLAQRIEADAPAVCVIGIGDPGIARPGLCQAGELLRQLSHLFGDAGVPEEVLPQRGGRSPAGDRGLQAEDARGQVQLSLVVHNIHPVADAHALRQDADVHLIVDLHLPAALQLRHRVGAQRALALRLVGVCLHDVPLIAGQLLFPGIPAPGGQRRPALEVRPVGVAVAVVVGVALQRDRLSVLLPFRHRAGDIEGGGDIGHRLLDHNPVQLPIEPQRLVHILAAPGVDVDVLVGDLHPLDVKGIGQLAVVKLGGHAAQALRHRLLPLPGERARELRHLVDAKLKPAVGGEIIHVPGDGVRRVGSEGERDLVEQVQAGVLGVEAHLPAPGIQLHVDDGVKLIAAAVTAQQVVPRPAHVLHGAHVLSLTPADPALKRGHAGVNVLRLGVSRDGQPAAQAGRGQPEDVHPPAGKIDDHSHTSR